MTLLRSQENQYRLKKSLLWQGQFGKVRKATCLTSGKTFACKSVTGENVHCAEQEVARLRDMADCQHVTKLHEAFTEQNNLHILTELCAGGTLADKVAEEGPLPTATAARILEALANFANDCASQGILHNDIKPENILLVSSHPDSAVKVADFGFARTHEYCSSGQITLGYGTKGYMAPEVEQLACHSHYSDMYSIGAVFHFMLFGEDHFHVKDGVVTLKPWDSYKKWKALDAGAQHLLEFLLHELPARRLNATTLLLYPWLYKAQGKPYPCERIRRRGLGLHVSEVPPLISLRIQQRERHPQHLPSPLEPCGAHMDVQALWHEYRMAAQLGQPQSVGQAGQAEVVGLGLTPYAAVHETSMAGTSSSGPHTLAAAAAAATEAPYDPPTVDTVAEPGSLPTRSPFAAAAVAPQGFCATPPKPGFRHTLDSSQYPYSVIPRRPDATSARQHGAAAHLHSATPPHSQYRSDESVSLSDSRSMLFSVSPMGSGAAPENMVGDEAAAPRWVQRAPTLPKMGEEEQGAIWQQEQHEGPVQPADGRDRLSRYQLSENVLGAGGFGKVRKATCLATGEVYACKEIRKTREDSKIGLEVDMLQIMGEYANVITLHDSFWVADTLYILTELCTGGTLADKVKSEGPLPRGTAARFLEVLANFANDCLDAEIFHNDLKPSNLLLATDGADSQLKVADFGLARTHDHCGTGWCRAYGTDGYAAPEVDQSRWHSHKSEMYCLGGVAYFMLCGEKHFVYKDGVPVFKALDSSPNWAALDQGAKDILMLLLHDRPEYRLTAAQLLHDPWLYEAQQKPFPVAPIFTPPVAEVPNDKSQRIQWRGRQCLPVFKNTSGADMDTHAKQPQHYMARHRGEPQVVQQAEAVQRGLPPCGAAPGSCTSGSAAEGSPSSLGDISSSAEFALHHPLRPVPKPAAMVFVEAAFHQHDNAGSADFASSAVCLAPVQPDSSSAQAYQPAHMQAPFETSGTARQYGSLDHSESRSETLSMPSSEAETGSASVPESQSLHSGSEYSSSGDDSSSESFTGSGHSSIPSDADSHSNSMKDLDLATLPSLMRSGDEVAPSYSMGEEQGQDHLLHHPHLQPQRLIAEAEEVAPCYSMAEQQGQDHLLHHPHLHPHRPIAEAEAEEVSVEGEDKAAMHTRLAQLQSMYDQQHQELQRERARRMAAESKLAEVTAERDSSRAECAELRLKLSMQQHPDSPASRMQDQGQRGCERQPQLPSIHDTLDAAAATKLDTDSNAALRPHFQQPQDAETNARKHNSMGSSSEGQPHKPQKVFDQQVPQACAPGQGHINSAPANAAITALTTGMHEAEMAEEVEMEEQACTNLPSALPQPCAQVGGAQVAPHAVKKRKRATENEGQVPHCDTGGVPMSDNQVRAAQGDEGPSRQQAPAKRVRYMGASDHNQQTRDTAVSAAHALHAEPGGSTTHSPRPAAPPRSRVRGRTAARRPPTGPVRRSQRLQEKQQHANNKGNAL